MGLALTAAATGCRPFHTPQPGATPTDRLIDMHPELRAGRFAVIADFERPDQIALFRASTVPAPTRIASPKPPARPRRRGAARRPPYVMGGHCLRVTFRAPDDAVVINNDAADNWYLKADWRPFDLFMMTLSVPTDGLRLRMAVSAGAGDATRTVETTVRVTRGWNIVRLDLAELDARIPLDDVRAIRLTLDGADAPTTVLIDDVILTADREVLLGDPDAVNGDLFLQRIARRYIVGAGGRFALTFARGQITEWYNLRGDPHRLHNLVAGTVLGPEPVVLQRHGGNPDILPSVDQNNRTHITARQQILEMSPVRAVITCERRFPHSAEPPRTPHRRNGRSPRHDRATHPDGLTHRWRYTIYPTGQLFVTLTTSDPRPTSAAGAVGLAVMAASTDRDVVRTHAGSAPHDAANAAAPNPRPGDTESATTNTTRPVTYATVRGAGAFDACLMYVLADAANGDMLHHHDDADRWHTLIATRNPTTAPTTTWRCGLLLAPADEVTDAAARAAQYAHPPAIARALDPPTPSPDPSHAPRFDHGEGCYLLTPRNGHVRVIIDGATRPLIAPAFRVVDAPTGRAWIYVNHVVFDRAARTPDGDLVFQLPGIIRARTLVEVLFQRRTPPG